MEPSPEETHESAEANTHTHTRTHTTAHLEHSQAVALLRLVREINAEKSIDEAILRIVRAATQLLVCDGAVLFVADPADSQYLSARSHTGLLYRIKDGEGIAGHTHLTGETLNITDASTHALFKAEVDGRREDESLPWSVLAWPIRDLQGHIVGTLEATNRLEGAATYRPFDEDNEEMMMYICEQVGVILERMRLMEQMRLANERVKRMFNILRALHNDHGLNSMLFTLVHSIPSLVDAQKCTVYLHDQAHGELLSLVGDEHVREPVTSSVAGKAAMEGVIINIRDLVSSPLYASLTEKPTQQKAGPRVVAKMLHRESRTYVTSVLCVPIMDGAGEKVCGVIEAVNKKNPQTSQGFSTEDEEALTTFALIVGPLFEKSSLYMHHQDEYSKSSIASHTRKSSEILPVEPSIAEGDEEEEEG